MIKNVYYNIDDNIVLIFFYEHELLLDYIYVTVKNYEDV